MQAFCGFSALFLAFIIPHFRCFVSIYRRFWVIQFTLLKGFNDFATLYPKLAKEWSDRNLPLTPDMVNEKSRKNVWWKCRVCGYDWKSVINSRVKGAMCPVCADRAVLSGYNDLATTDVHLLSEWDYEKNTDFSPEHISRHSMYSVWWKCPLNHPKLVQVFSVQGFP